MVKVFSGLIFAIKQTKTKKHKSNNIGKKVSRLCVGQVIKDEANKLCVSIKLNNTEESDKYIVSFEDGALDLRGKTRVYSSYPDKNGKYTLCIRSERDAIIHPGLETQFQVYHEGNMLSGYVIEINNKRYFRVKEFLTPYPKPISEIAENIDNSLPLFKK